MRADDNIYLSRLEVRQHHLLLGRRPETAQHLNSSGKCRESLFERLEVLKRQHGSGSQHRNLLSISNCFKRGAHSHFRLAVANITAEQSIHGGWLLEIAFNVPD